MLHENPDLIVGPMVTNPGTRDWTVLASLFATLDDMYFAHGPDHDAWLKATTGDLMPEKLAGTTAFMFETRFPLIPTAYASGIPALQDDYPSVWHALDRHSHG